MMILAVIQSRDLKGVKGSKKVKLISSDHMHSKKQTK